MNLKQHTFRACQAWLDMREQLGPDFAQAFHEGFVVGERRAPLIMPDHLKGDLVHLWTLGYLVGEYTLSRMEISKRCLISW